MALTPYDMQLPLPNAEVHLPNLPILPSHTIGTLLLGKVTVLALIYLVAWILNTKPKGKMAHD